MQHKRVRPYSLCFEERGNRSVTEKNSMHNTIKLKMNARSNVYINQAKNLEKLLGSVKTASES